MLLNIPPELAVFVAFCMVPLMAVSGALGLVVVCLWHWFRKREQ